MTTEEHTTRGVVPSVNDLTAGLVVLLTYAIRVGVVEEGREGYHVALLYLTTDFVLPLLAGVWLLALPTWQLYRKVS